MAHRLCLPATGCSIASRSSFPMRPRNRCRRLPTAPPTRSRPVHSSLATLRYFGRSLRCRRRRASHRDPQHHWNNRRRPCPPTRHAPKVTEIPSTHIVPARVQEPSSKRRDGGRFVRLRSSKGERHAVSLDPMRRYGAQFVRAAPTRPYSARNQACQSRRPQTTTSTQFQ
jgi:hypothetical protein